MMSSRGQAVIEYLLVVLFIVTLGIKGISLLGDFLGSTMGNLAHELSSHLTTGVCEQNCFYSGYVNGQAF